MIFLPFPSPRHVFGVVMHVFGPRRPRSSASLYSGGANQDVACLSRRWRCELVARLRYIQVGEAGER